jgi:hypothetical protein
MEKRDREGGKEWEIAKKKGKREGDNEARKSKATNTFIPIFKFFLPALFYVCNRVASRKWIQSPRPASI